MGRLWNSIRGNAVRMSLRKEKVGSLVKTDLGIVTIPTEDERRPYDLALWRFAQLGIHVDVGAKFKALSFEATDYVPLSDWRNLQKSLHALSIGYIGLIAVHLQIPDTLMPNVTYISFGVPNRNKGMSSLSCGVSGELLLGITPRDSFLGNKDRVLFFVEV